MGPVIAAFITAVVTIGISVITALEDLEHRIDAVEMEAREALIRSTEKPK